MGRVPVVVPIVVDDTSLAFANKSGANVTATLALIAATNDDFDDHTNDGHADHEASESVHVVVAVAFAFVFAFAVVDFHDRFFDDDVVAYDDDVHCCDVSSHSNSLKGVLLPVMCARRGAMEEERLIAKQCCNCKSMYMRSWGAEEPYFWT
uniref:Uncharacterized protein n=1 Tax=Glossina brevipalpis TaxID=37001 RepID=A0A1A9WTK6_9MUSC